jgi:hypothetical protein
MAHDGPLIGGNRMLMVVHGDIEAGQAAKKLEIVGIGLQPVLIGFPGIVAEPFLVRR